MIFVPVYDDKKQLTTNNEQRTMSQQQVNQSMGQAKQQVNQSMGQSSAKQQTKFCKVCKDSGKADYTSHNIKDNNGTVICPYLLSIKCNYCKKNGHTQKYCEEAKTNANEKYCGFCFNIYKSWYHNNNDDGVVPFYKTHYVRKDKNDVNSEITCPQLLKFECNICKQKGHTPKQCTFILNTQAPAVKQAPAQAVKQAPAVKQAQTLVAAQSPAPGFDIRNFKWDVLGSINALEDLALNNISYEQYDYQTNRMNEIQRKKVEEQKRETPIKQIAQEYALKATQALAASRQALAQTLAAVQASAVQASAVQASAVQASAVQASAVQASAVQASAAQTLVAQASAVQAPAAAQASAVQAPAAAQASAVQASAVQASAAQAPVSAQAPVAVQETPKKSWSSLASKKLESAPQAPHKLKEILLGIKTPIKQIAQPVIDSDDEEDEETFDFQPVDENIYNKPQENRSWSDMCNDEYDEM